jgi:hypothetical protein
MKHIRSVGTKQRSPKRCIICGRIREWWEYYGTYIEVEPAEGAESIVDGDDDGVACAHHSGGIVERTLA